jgi:hypothetical protein
MQMLLTLAVKVGEVGHGLHRRSAARWSAEQRGLKPVIVPLRSKRLRDFGGVGSLQVLRCCTQANRTTAGDLPQPQAHFKTSIEELL